MQRLNEAQRNSAIGRLEAGKFQTVIARVFNVNLSTISNLWNRFRQHGLTVTFQGQADQGLLLLLKTATSGYNISANDSEQQRQLLYPFLEGVRSPIKRSETDYEMLVSEQDVL